MDVKSMGTRELRDQIGLRVEAAYYLNEPTIITHNGKPRAVLISITEWQESTQQEAPELST